MYVYNLTAVVEQSVLADWQEWFAEVYEPTLAAREGLKVRVYKVLGAEEAQFAIHHEMSTTRVCKRTTASTRQPSKQTLW